MFGLINRDSLPTGTADEFEHMTASLKAWALKEHNEDGTHFTSSTTNIPLGGILPYAGSSAPNANWLLCDGSQVSRATYQPLFNLIGTTYGAGDGSTTFNLPDLRQRLPLGKAAAGTGSVLGSTGGAIDHTHSSGSLSGATGAASPGTNSQGSHNHGGATGSHTHTFTTGGIASFFTTLVINIATTGATNLAGWASTLFGDSHTHSGTTDSQTASISSDGSHSHTVNSHTHDAGTLAMAATGSANPPYLVLNYIVLAQ